MKTECSQLGFGFLGRREVVGGFDGGRISSDGGLMLVAEVDRRHGVTARIAQSLRERREAGKIQQPLIDMVCQRVYQILAGYEDCNDAAQMAGDAVLKLAVNRCPESDRDLASQPTLSRFENAVSRTDLYRASAALVELFIAQTPAPQRIILDIDPTVDPTHGSQQLSLFNGFYDTHCYLPVLIFGSTDGGSREPAPGRSCNGSSPSCARPGPTRESSSAAMAVSPSPTSTTGAKPNRASTTSLVSPPTRASMSW